MKLRSTFVTFLVIAAAAMAAPVRWETDMPKALAEAKKTSKHILMNFTGSDWCPWCFKLRDEVFATTAFQDFAGKNLILVEVDFPRRKSQSDALKQQNQSLAQQFGVPGFPTVVILNSQGEQIGTTGYRPGGGEKYVDHIKDLIAGKAK